MNVIYIAACFVIGTAGIYLLTKPPRRVWRNESAVGMLCMVVASSVFASKISGYFPTDVELISQMVLQVVISLLIWRYGPDLRWIKKGQ